jgi:hypothetical protein
LDTLVSPQVHHLFLVALAQHRLALHESLWHPPAHGHRLTWMR